MKKFTFALCLILSSASICFNAAAGWKKNQGDRTWWYQYSKGSYPKDKWEFIDNEWYYFDNEGYMVSDMWIGDYYLGSDGAMLKNTATPDNYRVGADGAWIPGISGQYSINSSSDEYGFRHKSFSDGVLKMGGFFYSEHNEYYMGVRTNYEEMELIFSPSVKLQSIGGTQAPVDISMEEFLNAFLYNDTGLGIYFNIVNGVIVYASVSS